MYSTLHALTRFTFSILSFFFCQLSACVSVRVCVQHGVDGNVCESGGGGGGGGGEGGGGSG